MIVFSMSTSHQYGAFYPHTLDGLEDLANLGNTINRMYVNSVLKLVPSGEILCVLSSTCPRVFLFPFHFRNLLLQIY